MKIKNFAKFQHFKDRRPPWIKLYRDILDNMEWHELDGDSAKALVMLWLIASENSGQLPEKKNLAFRLRMSEEKLSQLLSNLSDWLDCSDTELISTRYQDEPVADESYTDTVDFDAGETETETEIEEKKNSCAATQRVPAQDSFDRFYSIYPKKKNRGDAEKAWKQLKPDALLVDRIVSAVERASKSKDWAKDGGQYIPYPASWLRAKGWEDEIQSPASVVVMPKKYRMHHLGFVEEHSVIGGISGWSPTMFRSIEEYEAAKRSAA